MSTSQLICIKRPEPSLSALFEDMYINERLVDVTLSCSDGQLQAHRLVLAASSPYFSGLFDKLPNPFHYPVIVIKDMRLDDLKLIVEFMYRGQLTVGQDRLNSLIKSADNLQITGLSSGNSLVSNSLESRDAASNNTNSNNHNNSKAFNQRFKRVKKLGQHQSVFGRAYSSRQDESDSRMSPQPEKLLEQSMITGESLDDSHPSHHFSYATSDPTSTRNLNNQHLHTSTPSLHLQHISSADQHQHQHQQQLSNQLQVLSHSLAANRSSLTQGTATSQSGSQLQQQQQQQQLQHQQQSRGRVHPCNICWKTFREKANLKRHLQVHSLDRIIYACPECNKTFSWKDNYIRHTKTAHHMNNARPQT